MSCPALVHKPIPRFLLIGYVVADLAFLTSWPWSEPGRQFWQRLDEHTFRWLNGTLADPGAWQILWALANSRRADVVPAQLLPRLVRGRPLTE